MHFQLVLGHVLDLLLLPVQQYEIQLSVHHLLQIPLPSLLILIHLDALHSLLSSVRPFHVNHFVIVSSGFFRTFPFEGQLDLGVDLFLFAQQWLYRRLPRSFGVLVGIGYIISCGAE